MKWNGDALTECLLKSTETGRTVPSTKPTVQKMVFLFLFPGLFAPWNANNRRHETLVHAAGRNKQLIKQFTLGCLVIEVAYLVIVVVVMSCHAYVFKSFLK